MSKKLKIFAICIIASLSFVSCDLVIIDKKEVSEKLDIEMKKIAEEAYFEGQKDAMSGDIRISLGSDSCWTWTKSPWNDGDKPLFDPKNSKNKK